MHRKAEERYAETEFNDKVIRFDIYCFDLLEHYIYFLCRFGCGDRHSKQNNT